jgi:AcrR family transcriptional regulator
MWFRVHLVRESILCALAGCLEKKSFLQLDALRRPIHCECTFTLRVMTEKRGTQVRQEQIARATLELAAIGGVKKVSIAAVARRVGIVPSALYRHFKSKEEMIEAVLDLIQQKLRDNAQAVQAQDVDPLEQLRRLLMLHAQLIRENRGIPQVIFSQDLYAGHPHRRRRMYEGIRNYLEQVAQIIAKAQAAGQADPKADPKVVATMFLGLIQPAAILWNLSDGDFDVTRQARAAWPLFCRALQAAGEGGSSRTNKRPSTTQEEIR